MKQNWRQMNKTGVKWKKKFKGQQKALTDTEASTDGLRRVVNGQSRSDEPLEGVAGADQFFGITRINYRVKRAGVHTFATTNSVVTVSFAQLKEFPKKRIDKMWNQYMLVNID